MLHRGQSDVVCSVGGQCWSRKQIMFVDLEELVGNRLVVRLIGSTKELHRLISGSLTSVSTLNHLLEVNDPRKFLSIQASSPNKSSINVRFSHKLINRVRRDAPAVQNPDILCH